MIEGVAQGAVRDELDVPCWEANRAIEGHQTLALDMVLGLEPLEQVLCSFNAGYADPVAFGRGWVYVGAGGE